MECIEALKQVAETITACVTAGIVIESLVKKIPIVKRLIAKFISFCHGTTTLDGKRVRFFKGAKEKKERKEIIIKALAPDLQMEDVLVVDKTALPDILLKSGAFKIIRMREHIDA